MYGTRAAADLLRLAAEAGTPLRLALAGRSRERLAAARAHVLELAGPGAADAELALIDGCEACDTASMARLATSTRVLINCTPIIQ